MKNKTTGQAMTADEVARMMVEDRLTSFAVLPFGSYGVSNEDERAEVVRIVDAIVGSVVGAI